MSDLRNCPRCNKIFVRNFRDVCPDCYRKEEEDFQKVYQYIRKKENRTATILEVEEATEVEQKFIHQFIKQGRIHLHSFPNLSYPCESCGVMIREGRICTNCKNNITGGMQRIESEERFEKRKQAEERKKVITYHSLQHKINKKDKKD